MARKRTPCEWCEQDLILKTDYEAKNVEGTIEIYPDNGLLSVIFQGINDEGGMTHEEIVDIPYYYCPNCGRKLGL